MTLRPTPRIFRRGRPKSPRSTNGRFQSRNFIMLLLFLAITLEAAVSASSDDAASVVEEARHAFNGSAYSMDWRHPPVSEHVVTQIGQSSSSSSSSRTGRKRSRRLQRMTDVTESGTPCRRNPLWDRRVDAVDYEYGCRAIERMLAGDDATLIGGGKLRDVFLVEYEGRQLAVKTLKHVDEMARQKVHLSMHRREVLTLDALRGHENIVGMLGLCGTTVVTEYVPESFKTVAFRHGKEMPHGQVVLPLDRVVSLALGAAKGLQALHETVGAILVDMKPHMLLVDGTRRGIIANGLGSVHLMSTNPTGHGGFCKAQVNRPLRVVPWRAPENVAGEPLTEKADIYGMGMVFYSLIAGREPYDSQESFKLALFNRTRPEIDPSWHKGFMKIVKHMWREDPNKRPSARQVVAWLQSLLDDL